MNSLEKLIRDLEDSKDIVEAYKNEIAGDRHYPDDHFPNENQARFIMNSIQSAINRLKVIEEEIEVQE